MTHPTSLLPTQRVVQICLFLIAAIAIMGGAVQMYLGQPDTTSRLDNIHRFMAGVYFTAGVTGLWAGITIRQQNTLVFLLALAAFLGGVGRLVSMSQVGLPEPTGLWIGYLVPELSLPCIMVVCQIITNKKLK